MESSEASGMRKNKDVLVHQIEGDQKLFLVALQLKHHVGAVADVTKRLEVAKFNMLSGFISAPDTDGIGRFSFFVEATVGRPSVSDLKRLLTASSFVQEAEVKESHNGIIVDSLNFPLSWNSGDRAIMLRSHFFAVMEADARDMLQSGADVLFYQMGIKHGRPTWDDLLSMNRVRDKADLEELISIYAAIGWGSAEVASFDLASRNAVVRIRENFECGSGTKKSHPGSNFVRGHLAGLFSSLFGGETTVKETRCISKGDEYCEFKAVG
ncbi:MAG: hypothetical protein KGI38_10965 [Thaumarchaeota archaeon]|nr:hypothetical protein [Nitrososphaerota archaeon]